MENSILRDSKSNNAFWQNFTQQTLNVSEQFILSNAFGFNEYCLGGDFTTAMDAIMQNFTTVETAQDYPYAYASY